MLFVRAGQWSKWYVCVGRNGFFATEHPSWFDVVWRWHVQFGFSDWTGEFWWILARQNDQQEITFTRLRMLITWRWCKPPSIEHPSYGLLLQFIISCVQVSFNSLVCSIFR
jgi:hypothetical protein